MPARLIDHRSPFQPVQHGMLRVASSSHDPDSAREAHDVVIDSRGELSAVMLRLEASREDSSVYGALAVARDALLARKPVYEIVGSLRAWCANPENDASLGVMLLRFSQPDSRIEILNAGMPGVACALPGARVAMHPSLSGPIRARAGDVHPYELSPLVWGTVWVMMSKGLTGGSVDADSAHARVLTHDLADKGRALAGLSAEELAPWLTRIAGHPIEGDASLVIVHADPTRRFQSGIR